MKKSRGIFVCLCTLLSLAGGISAHSTQPLIFSTSISSVDRLAVSSVLGGAVQDYVFSYADLNGDDQDEIIAVGAVCKRQPLKMCEYTVVGFGQEKSYVLLHEKAWNVAVSDDVRYGVRKLLVFKTVNNQYRDTPYTWNALESLYTESEGDNQT